MAAVMMPPSVALIMFKSQERKTKLNECESRCCFMPGRLLCNLETSEKRE